jgi:putative oxidoreductase
MNGDRLGIIASHAGRIVLASLFLFAGILKIASYGPTAQSMESAALAPTSLLLPLTILLKLGGGLLVAVGRRGAVPAVLLLAVFTIATNIFFHDFWTMEGGVARMQGSLFLKNIATAGGLLFVAGTLVRTRATKEIE